MATALGSCVKWPSSAWLAANNGSCEVHILFVNLRTPLTKYKQYKKETLDGTNEGTNGNICYNVVCYIQTYIYIYIHLYMIKNRFKIASNLRGGNAGFGAVGKGICQLWGRLMLHARQPARQKGPASGSADSLTSLLGSSLDTGRLGRYIWQLVSPPPALLVTRLAPYTLNSVVSHLWQSKCTWHYGVL